MRLSFIISTFNRPQTLLACLNCLALQTARDSECIVTDNSTDDILASQNEYYAKMAKAGYLRTRFEECYSSAEEGVKMATGKWLCFPSDDNWYCNLFSETMLRHAESNHLDFVYCDCLYGRPGQIPQLFITQPRVNEIDKGGFCVKRELFKEFPGKAKISCSDGYFIEQLVKSGRKHGKAPGILWCHQ